MKTRDKLETVLGKRLRLAMRGRSIPEVAEIAGVSEATLKNLRSGRTVSPRRTTLQRIAEALDTTVEALTAPGLSADDEQLADHLLNFGPSVSSAIRFGNRRTLWLNYDICEGFEYGYENVTGRKLDRRVEVPPSFQMIKNHIIQNNQRLQMNPSEGQAFFDGPSFCLSHYSLNHSADGHEIKSLYVEFSNSTYANNVTAKSTSAQNLRRTALSQFQFLDQPIEWLASGVGVAVVVFCDEGDSVVVCRRSDRERFRSREYDVSVVEGINPVKDIRDGDDRINIYDVALRGIEAELGLRLEVKDVAVFGFGLDLQYYQWNFLALADARCSFDEIELKWQGASEKFETMALEKMSSNPMKAARFLSKRPVWSSGLAAAFFALQKWHGDKESVLSAFSTEF